MIHFDLDQMKNEIENLEKQTMEEGFWNDSKNSGKVLQQIKLLKGRYTKFTRIIF